MKEIFALFILLAGCTHAFAEQDKLHEDWIKDDEIFIGSLKNAYTKNPTNIVQVLKPGSKQKTQLGFGYSIIEGSNGKGYVSTFYRLIYKNNMMVGFELDQQMPADVRLIERYKKLYAGMFEVEGNKTKPKYYNYQEMTQPLEGYKSRAPSFAELDFYMTPYSGNVYGVRGGFANTLIKNREYYLALKPKLTPDLYQYLLYSKNPATRLVAIEFFHGQKNIEPNIKNRIEEIFSELPNVETMSGCILHSDSARSLIEEYVRKDVHAN